MKTGRRSIWPSKKTLDSLEFSRRASGSWGMPTSRAGPSASWTPLRIAIIADFARDDGFEDFAQPNGKNAPRPWPTIGWPHEFNSGKLLGRRRRQPKGAFGEALTAPCAGGTHPSVGLPNDRRTRSAPGCPASCVAAMAGRSAPFARNLEALARTSPCRVSAGLPIERRGV